MNNLEKEASKYLKTKKEYKKIMEAFKEKYKKTGKLTGKIKLNNISKEESLILGSIDYSLFGVSEGSLSVKKFIDFFSQGKFEGIDFIQVLKEYFGENNLKTNKEINENKELVKEEFFVKLFNELKNEKVKLWLKEAIKSKKFGYQSILRGYKEDSNKLFNVISNIDKAFDYLDLKNSEYYIPLAKFSSIITKDSHYFDIDNFQGKLFISCIGYIYNTNTETTENKNEALMKVNIIRDEISNFTITYGLVACDDNGEIQGYKWFRKEKQPLLLNTYNLNFIKEIKALNDKVYVFENPTVFYELLRRTENIPVTLICTSGQPNISSLILLDKLTKSKATIYYSGDFDPEGLQIASNLKNRYKDNLKFLGMNEENYLKIKGNISFEQRIGKLNNINNQEFKELIEQMKIYKKAGYQELLIDYYYNILKED